MRHHDDLERGIVIRFIDRPGQMYGFIAVLDEDESVKTGETLWFHFNDGQHVMAYSGESVEWSGPTDSYGRRLRTPKAGDKIAFDRGIGRNKQDKADPWTYAHNYQEACFTATSRQYQILHGNGNVAWQGRFSQSGQVRLTGGPLPILEENMVVQELLLDDIADGEYGDAYLIPGGWVDCVDQESAYVMLRKAQLSRV